MARVGVVFADFIARTAKFTRGTKKARKDLSEFERAVQDTKRQVAGLFAGGSAVALVQQTAQAANQTRIYADALGLSTERLSALGYATQTVGITTEQVGDILKDFAEKIGEAYAEGSGEGQEALDALGLSAEALNRLNPADQLEAIGAAVGQLQTRGEQIVVLEKLGNDAALLLPLLDDNAAALRQLQEEAENVGAIVTEGETQAIQEAGASVRRLTSEAEALGRTIVEVLGPAFSGVVDVIADATGAVRGFLAETATGIRRIAEWAAAASIGDISWREFFSGSAEAGRRIEDRLSAPIGARDEEEPAELPTLTVTAPRIRAPRSRGRATAATRRQTAAERELNAARREAERIIQSLLTPQETYVQQMTRLHELHAQGLIDQENFNRAVASYQEELHDAVLQTEEANTAAQELGLTFTSAFEDAIIGAKGLQDVLKGLLQDISRIILRRTVTEPLGGLLQSGLGNLFKNIVPFSGGGIARGPQLALFGEGSTPEAFVPVPNGRIPVDLRGTGMAVTVNNSYGPDADIRVSETSGGLTIDVVRAALASDLSTGGQQWTRSLDSRMERYR